MGSMTDRDDVLAGLQLIDVQAWASAYRALSEADSREPLACAELEALATAAYLAGMDEESDRAWARAFTIYQRSGDWRSAVRCGFWLTFRLVNAHDQARAGGWIARARKLLQERGDCVERGYLSYLDAMQVLFFSGDVASAEQSFADAARIGDQHSDLELATLARTGQGRCLIYLAQAEAGLALLDEAMVAVTSGEVSPVATADTYCTVIEGCQELFDLRRMQVWTSALSAWCDAQPELVAFRGQCMVDRCEVLQLSGDWPTALAEARRASDQLATPRPRPPIGAAYYQQGELHRLRGEGTTAEAAYRRAGESGRDPQPGLALLRLARGKLEPANRAIQRALAEAGDHVSRARLLPAQVEISLAAGHWEAATRAAGELAEIAAAMRAPLLRAMSATADGRVALACGDAQAALGRLRAAEQLWIELEVPYELARVRLLIADACGTLGDHDGEATHRAAARAEFARLGAAGELSRLEGVADTTVLTGREIEVIRHIAAGESNREIADALVISERTVERHVSNIFTKLGITSRAAATAYAYEHGLV